MMLDEVDKVGADWRGDPRARCSRCSTRPRTTRSATTTSRSTSTCPRCCSSRPPTCPRRSRARCSTGWRSSGSTLHGGREGRDRARSPARAAGGAQRPAFDEVEMTDDGPSDRERLHPGGRRAEPRARARQGPAQGGHPARERRGAGPRSGRRRRRPRVPRTTKVLLRGRRAHERAPASRPGWRSPAPAATSCSSRPRVWRATRRTR